MFTWIMIGLMAFFAWRAVLYFSGQRPMAGVLALLGSALFAGGVFVDFKQHQANALPALSAEERAKAESDAAEFEKEYRAKQIAAAKNQRRAGEKRDFNDPASAGSWGSQ